MHDENHMGFGPWEMKWPTTGWLSALSAEEFLSIGTVLKYSGFIMEVRWHESERSACEAIWREAACQSRRWFVKGERLDAEWRSAYEKSHGIANGKACSSVESSENFEQS